MSIHDRRCSDGITGASVLFDGRAAGKYHQSGEILHVTQPTLSRQLAQIEEELGIRLFERGKRKIVLTNEGILLCRRAREILELVDKTEKELVEQESVVEGTISIGCGDVKRLICWRR